MPSQDVLVHPLSTDFAGGHSLGVSRTVIFFSLSHCSQEVIDRSTISANLLQPIGSIAEQSAADTRRHLANLLHEFLLGLEAQGHINSGLVLACHFPLSTGAALNLGASGQQLQLVLEGALKACLIAILFQGFTHCLLNCLSQRH